MRITIVEVIGRFWASCYVSFRTFSEW